MNTGSRARTRLVLRWLWLPFVVLVLALAPGLAFAEALVCAACGHAIGPGTYVQDRWGAPYHRQHAKLPRCVYCWRGISPYNTGGGVRYPDGRQVCGLCNASAVHDLDAARDAEARVRRVLEGWGLHFAYGEIPVHLVDQPRLRRLSGARGAHGGRIAGLTVMRGVMSRQGHMSRRKLSIAMLDGMPLAVFEKTMAHELMHAWMFLDGEPEHVPALEEGVCDLASYYMLQDQNTPEAGFTREAMFASSDPTYGAGLRRAIRYVQRHRFTGLVALLRSRRDFPPGS